MSAEPSRRSLVAVGLLCVAALAGILLEPGRGQAPGPEPEARRPKRAYLDAEACTRCHGEPKPAADPFALVRLDEKHVWIEKDKHHQAYGALLGERGRRMGELLKEQGLLETQDVSRAKECLSCHSTGFLPQDPAVVSPAAEIGKKEGVTCAACHGPYQDYVQRHGFKGDLQDEWRELTAKVKEETYGLTNLRDPARRAEVCFSCHVGNAEQGKVVSHAMYAAGHPPLPGIELTAFSRAMPPHWWEPEQVPRFRNHPEVWPRYGHNPQERHQTKSTVIGGAVALRESMALLAAESARRAAKRARPEFASLDCTACHHDLQAPGDLAWRQKLGPERLVGGVFRKIVPGRPRARHWPFALSELGLLFVESHTADRTLRAEYQQAAQALRTAYDARPFGKPDDIAQAARGLEAWSRKLIEALKSSPFDSTTPPKLLNALTTLAEREPPDYDTARQLVWAFRAIYADWEPKPPRDQEIRAALAALDRRLKLDPDQSEAKLQDSLTRAAAHDPEPFQKAFAALARLLGAPGPVATVK